jgi:hypothetical protein
MLVPTIKITEDKFCKYAHISHWPTRKGNAVRTQSSDFLKLKLIYDRRSVGQSVLVSGSHLEPMTDFCFCLTIAGFLMCGTLSDERMGL